MCGLIDFKIRLFDISCWWVQMAESNNPSNDPQPQISDLISFDQAAKISGFTDRHLRKLAHQNLIWAIRIGRNWFTTAEAVQRYVATNRKPGPKPKKQDT